MATDKPRFTLTVPDEMLREIDDFRFDNRYNTRTEAVLALIQRGLDSVKKDNGEIKAE